MSNRQQGFYLRPDIYVTGDGEIFQATDDGQGLGKINWDKVGDFFKPIVGGVAKRIEGPRNDQAQLPPAQYLPPVSGGGFQMDTTTLLLIAGAAMLFLSKPGGK